MGAVKEPVATLYETDFAAWAEQQAAALQRRDWKALDLPNLVEEIESMGKQQLAELRNRLVVLLTHLLKLDAQPRAASHHRSWRLSILEQRNEIGLHLRHNPSLQPYIDEAMADAFDVARVIAARESGVGLSELPAACPYDFGQAMNAPIDVE